MANMALDRWSRPAVILVATDLSDLDRLMPFALEQASQVEARLILLHVLVGGAAISVDAAGMPLYDPVSAMEFAGKTLNPWCAAARERNVACDALLREGDVAQQIELASHQFHADRLLLGTRGRSRLGKLLLGSVAEQVLRSVTLPVMTVGPEAHLPVNRGGLQPVVLHATTLRETSRPSAALACQVASSLGAKLILLHVLPPLDEMERDRLPIGMDSVALRELRMLASETGAGCCACVDSRVVHGNPHIEILAEAAQCGANLIVLGSAHHSVFENLTRDQVVYRVLAHARCPVLTLREADAGQVEPLRERQTAHR